MFAGPRESRARLSGKWPMVVLCAAAVMQLFLEGSQSNAKEPEPAAPVFSVSGGIYTNAITTEIKVAGAVVRISLDGSEPGFSSAIYDRPLQITNCTLVRAKAFFPDGRASRTVTQN